MSTDGGGDNRERKAIVIASSANGPARSSANAAPRARRPRRRRRRLAAPRAAASAETGARDFVGSHKSFSADVPGVLCSAPLAAPRRSGSRPARPTVEAWSARGAAAGASPRMLPRGCRRGDAAARMPPRGCRRRRAAWGGRSGRASVARGSAGRSDNSSRSASNGTVIAYESILLVPEVPCGLSLW